MNYKYKKGQIFGKKLPVPKDVLQRIYGNTLSFPDYIKYDLVDKIPITCLDDIDRKLVERFGFEKVKILDWELLTGVSMGGYETKEMLLELDPSEDLNKVLHDLAKKKIKPKDYSKMMKEQYPDFYFELKGEDNDPNRSFKVHYNDGMTSLNDIISHWEVAKDMDLSFCLTNSGYSIDQNVLKDFVNKHLELALIILDQDDIKILDVINHYNSLEEQEEKDLYLRELARGFLDKTKTDKYYFLSNDEYKALFSYYSFKDFLLTDRYNSHSDIEKLLKELKDLPEDYIFNINIPISILINSNVISFISEYGLKNVVNFDNECGNFFTKNNCEMLLLMEDMYLHYGGTMFDPRSYEDRINGVPLTKDQFYEAMRRMIVNGPTNSNFAGKAPNYNDMVGEFRTRNIQLFISDEAPEELKTAFYTKKITPNLLKQHRDYAPFLEGKNFESCFPHRSVAKANYEYENLYTYLSKKMSYDEFIDLITDYAEIFDAIYDKASIYGSLRINVDDDLSKDEILDVFDKAYRTLLFREGYTYSEDAPEHFKEKNPDLFLPKDMPLSEEEIKELKEAFYGRKIDTEFLLSHPKYIDILKNVNLEIVFKFMPLENGFQNTTSVVGLIQSVFKEDTFDFMLLYGKYVEQLFENGLTYDLAHKRFDDDKEYLIDSIDDQILRGINAGLILYDENIPTHFKNNNSTLFLPSDTPDEIKEKYYKKQFKYSDFLDNPDLIDYFKNTNIIFGFSKEYIWLTQVFTDLSKLEENNLNALKIISNYVRIHDGLLQGEFRDYILENKDNLDYNRINVIADLFVKLAHSNSKELHSFREILVKQLMDLDDPLTAANEIEKIFVKNNIPTVGKIYAAFEILHPDFQGFDFEGESSMVSPALKKSSTTSKKFIVFSDLIKASLGSNNRSINAYLKSIETGNNLYKSIKNGTVKYEELDEDQKEELINFANHLLSLYERSMKGRNESKSIKVSSNPIETIDTLVEILSPDGSLDYDLADRVVSMFCGFSGIETLEEAKNYVKGKVESADRRNRERAEKRIFTLDQGDLIKGIGSIRFFEHILQNGSVSKEYLGASAGSDATPLDTDLSVIETTNSTFSSQISSTAAKGYGPIWIVLKRDDRFYVSRDKDGEKDVKRDLSRYELFYTGVCGDGHYGIRTGFASSEIDYIILEEMDQRVALEIAKNGFYIPIVNKQGELLFTPKDYDKLREKMAGLKRYGENEFVFSDNLVTEDTLEMAKKIPDSEKEVQDKRACINAIIQKSLSQLGIGLKTQIDGDLSPGTVELIDTGSTGRGTNKPGDGDFDFMMRLDRDVYSDVRKMKALKDLLLQNFGKLGVKGEITGSGDFRLKNVDVGNGHIVDIDITFTAKTDKISYSTDMCLQDRLSTIKKQDPAKYNLVVSNILLAKKVLKDAGVYKPNRGDTPQGGLGGVGIENWILQNGGSFIDAAKSFLAAAEGKTFEQFKDAYRIWDFGENHLAESRGTYVHDNFVTANMSEAGYNKMVAALKAYLLSLDKNQEIKEQHTL